MPVAFELTNSINNNNNFIIIVRLRNLATDYQKRNKFTSGQGGN